MRAEGSGSLFEKHLAELKEFRDARVVAHFDVAAERRGVRGPLLAPDTGWCEVRWIDDRNLQMTLITLSPSSPIPKTWRQKDATTWLVPTNEIGPLAAWFGTEWAFARGNSGQKLKMWSE